MADPLHSELLSALLDGQLAPEQKAAIEEHLQNHSQDAAVFDDLQRLRKQLRGLPSLSAPADFKQRVLQRIYESAAVPAIAATPSIERGSNRTVWLLACAASLAALLLAGVFYSLNRNDPILIAERDPAEANTSQPAGLKTGPQNTPSETAAVPKDNESTAKLEQPTPVAAEPQPAGLGKNMVRPKPAVEVSPMPPAAAKADQPGDLLVPSTDVASLALELGQQVSPTPANEFKNRSAFGGGMGGRAKEDAEGLAKAGAVLSNGLRDAPSGAFAESTEPSETCVRLDQLIFVQVPVNQPAEEWIESVFRQAEVQIDSSDEPDSFRALVLQRENDRKQASSDSESDRALAAKKEQESSDARALAEKSQPELSPAPEYLKPDQTTTAYWVDAEVRQIRTIMDRLDGAVVVGFPNPGKWGPHGEERAQQKSFPANPAIARRLGQLDVPAKPNESTRQSGDEKASEGQRAIEALGLQYQLPTARYRILFVFHGSTAPAALKSDALESKPAPVK